MRSAILLALTLLAATAQAADAGACYTISYPDARTWCRARAHQDARACYAIQRPDLRAQCQAEARR